ncbi:diiron oxygenase [Actinomycetes bacterium M1A6_2h]
MISTFDPDVDVDWSAPWRFDLYAMPPERVSLYASRVWTRMSGDERRDRALHEAVAHLSFGATLLVENMLAAAFGDVVHDVRVAPHVRQALRLFASERDQRTDFAREQVVRSMERGNVVSRAYHRTLLAVVANAIVRMPAAARVRPTSGPGLWRTRGAATRGARIARARAVGESVEFFRAVGLMDGALARTLWRSAGTTAR